MGGSTVETEALREASRKFTEYADEFTKQVGPALGRATLPKSAIPLVDCGFADAYAQAWQAMDVATRAGGGSMKTIGLALTLIANHYEGQEAENTKMFHGKPIDPPAVPQPQKMDISSSILEHGEEFLLDSGAGAILLSVTTTLILASTGIGAAAIVLPVGIFCMSNIIDPVPYFQAASAWGEIEAIVTEAAAKVPKEAAKITSDAKWSGDGCDAFNNYVTNDLSPVLGAMQGLAGSLKQMCTQTAWVAVAAIGAYVIGTLEATAVVAEADADPEPISRETVGFAAVGAWLPWAIGISIELISTFGDMAVAASTIESSTRALGAQMERKDGQIQAGALALSPTKTTAIQDWSGWKNEKVPA